MYPNTPATETVTSPYTRIIHAARNGNLDMIRVLIAEEVDLNARDREDNTALHLASKNGHTEIVKALLTGEGIDINARDREDNTALHLASENGHTEIVKALLTGEGIDINARENFKWTPLHYAARNGHIEVVEVLLKNGAPVDLVSDEYDTPLHFAARNGHIEVVEVLLKNGANIEAEGIYYNQLLEIDFTLTPLHYAAEWDHAKVVELLLKNGACVSKMVVGDKDYSAIEWVLSKFNNNPDVKDKEREEIINILFKYGANISPELLRKTHEDNNISDTTKELVTELSQPERILARDEALREDPDLIKAYKNFILNGKLALDSVNTLVLYNESFGDVVVNAINSITKEELKEIKETDPEKFGKIQESGFSTLIELNNTRDNSGANKAIIKNTEEFKIFHEKVIELLQTALFSSEEPKDPLIFKLPLNQMLSGDFKSKIVAQFLPSDLMRDLRALGESSTSLFIDDLLAISSSKINEIKKRRTDNFPPANSEALQSGAPSSSQEVNPTLGEKRSNSNFSASRRAEAGSPAKKPKTEEADAGSGGISSTPSSSTSLSGKREKEEGSANTQLAGESLTKKPNTGEVSRGN